ncbi:MAG TPA: glycosyltransferase family 2 protein, partial [Syntrophales bacterium]|nr:glycosyltransferase family 2 protein [Syntrophales bacterium]
STVEVCKGYGARVFCDEWLGYGRQKNLCQDRARNAWILNIDADERVTPELRDEILGLPEKGDKVGYYLPMRNFFGGRWIRHCGWYPDYHLRLYRKDLGRFSEREVHEAIELEGPRAYLKNPLNHYTYRDASDYLERMERYSSLAAKQMLSEGKRPRITDIALRPPFTFLKMFVLQLGFLDGRTGLLLSTLYAYYTYTKYAKLREMKP